MNKSIKVLIVDDEFLALNLLEEFISKLPALEIIAKAKSASIAQEILNEHKIDLMFLDIQMPHLSGNEFLKKLPNPPVTIFTTAYEKYAVEAFSLNAIDYLLKPFSFTRFEQAVIKAKEQISKENKSEDFITIKSDGKVSKIVLNDILYIEGQKEYVKINCVNKKYIILDSLLHLEEILPVHEFIRVHKSYIIPKSKITAKEGFNLFIDKIKIPMSRKKKKEICEFIFD